MKRCIVSFIIKIVIAAAVFVPSTVCSEIISNVRYYRVSENTVAMYYDLSGTVPANIAAEVTTDGGLTYNRLSSGLSGDIGEGILPGSFKRIEWCPTDGLPDTGTSFGVRVLVVGAVGVESANALPGGITTVQRFASPIEFDGISDEAAWEGIEPFPVIMQAPSFGTSPSERTEILLGYDDEFIYVAGRMYDSEPSRIQSTTLKRDDDDESCDSFGFILDTFNDNENALLFMTTPGGSRIDKSIYGDMLSGGSSAGGSNVSWNTFWDVKTLRTNEGWFAEIRIPLSSIRFQDNEEGIVMGFSAFRWIARKDERIVHPAISQQWGSSSHLKPSLASDIVLHGIKSHSPLYITPYILGGLGQTSVINDSGNGYELDGEPETEAGLDLKYGLTGNMTLDLTYNTDFAQVEADDQQVNLTRFSLFFPEKRQFFLERESNFDFRFYGRNRLFHSRRIGIHEGARVPIIGGARIYGRAGDWDIGFLSMQTDKIKTLPSENFGVLRLRRQMFNPYSYVGGIMTSRMGTDGAYNTAYGFDGSIRLFGDDILKFNWAQTFENEAENDPSDLDISKIRVHWERYRHIGWGYGLNYSRAGERYNPGMGFEQYENLTSYIHFIRYGWAGGPDSRWFKFDLYEDYWLHIRNTDNRVKSCLARFGGHGDTKSGYSSGLSLTYSYEDVRELLRFSDSCDVPFGTYEFYGFSGNFSTPGGRLFSVKTSFQGGQFYDGHRMTLSVSPTRSVSTHLEVGGTYELNKVDFSERAQKFDSHIGRLRLLAMLNVKYSLSAFVQYNNIGDTVISNVRLRYNPKEGNDLYLVYDEAFNMNREREEPLLPLTKNRTILLKYNYTFNL